MRIILVLIAGLILASCQTTRVTYMDDVGEEKITAAKLVTTGQTPEDKAFAPRSVWEGYRSERGTGTAAPVAQASTAAEPESTRRFSLPRLGLLGGSSSSSSETKQCSYRCERQCVNGSCIATITAPSGKAYTKKFSDSAAKSKLSSKEYNACYGEGGGGSFC